MKPTHALLAMALVAALPAAAQDPSSPEGTPLFANGFESGNTLAWDARVPPEPAPDVFRILDLDLRDPHVFVDVPPFGCLDFTDTALPAGLGPSFNDSLQTAIETDDDGDGFLDFSFVLGFRPFSDSGTGLRIDAGCGLCTDPIASTVCDWDREMVIPRTTTYGALTSGLCLESIPGTTSGYSPSVPATSGPCVVTDIGLAPILVLVVEGVPIILEDGQLAGSLVGDPVFRLEDGLMRGFLSETDADGIILPVGGGIALSSLLPGGAGSCAPGDDRDMNHGVSGWWFYLEHVAETAAFVGD
jgi:hypothetical protein